MCGHYEWIRNCACVMIYHIYLYVITLKFFSKGTCFYFGLDIYPINKVLWRPSLDIYPINKVLWNLAFKSPPILKSIYAVRENEQWEEGEKKGLFGFLNKYGLYIGRLCDSLGRVYALSRVHIKWIQCLSMGVICYWLWISLVGWLVWAEDICFSGPAPPVGCYAFGPNLSEYSSNLGLA